MVEWCYMTNERSIECKREWRRRRHHHHHHHVPEGLGVLSCFLNPRDEVGPSTSSLVVPCSFVLLVYIVMLVLVVYLCPSSVRVVATFSGIVLFPLLYSVLLIFPNTLILFFI